MLNTKSLKVVNGLLENYAVSGMTMDFYLGFVSGVLSCSLPIEDVDYINDLIGDEDNYELWMERFDAWFKTEKSKRALSDIENTLCDALYFDNYILAEHYHEIEGDFVSWCRGYITAFSYTIEQWQEDFAYLKQLDNNEGLSEITDEFDAITTLIEFFANWYEEDQTIKDKALSRPLEESLSDVSACISFLFKVALWIEHVKLLDKYYPFGEERPEDFDGFDDVNDFQFVDSANDLLFHDDEPHIAESKVGRNDPCPCGSGKKYKKCCYLIDSDNVKPENLIGDVSKDVKQAMQGEEFDSMDEANEFLNDFMQQRNSQSIDVFHGISSDKMHSLLAQPFANNGVLALNEHASVTDADFTNNKVMFLTNALIDGIGDKGIKATAKGNLPRNLCRAIHAEYINLFGAPKYSQPVNKEEDFFDLHTVRVLFDLAKLARVYKGKYILTAPMNKLLKKPERMQGKVYLLLFKAYCIDFNWAYRSYDEEFAFIQQSVGFSLYMISKHGNTLKDSNWYAQQFLSAFPRLVDVIEVHPYLHDRVDEQIYDCYNHWFIENFCEFFGLITIKSTKSSEYDEQHDLQTTPLFNTFIKALGNNSSLSLVQ